ncbi:MAG: PemK-like protein [Acidobacteriaceae bacterium]|nr:PemK-like protein [Acidobacteriaceae bacterium]
MKRGELYRVYKPGGDPKHYRTFVIVSRQVLIESKFSTVICAPVFTSGEGLSTQVPVGVDEGLKHSSWIMCDNLVSLRKADLTQLVGSFPKSRFVELERALKMALDIP